VTDIEIGAFQTGPRNPEQDALLPIIGSARKGDSIDTTIGDYCDFGEPRISRAFCRGYDRQPRSRIARSDTRRPPTGMSSVNPALPT